MPSATHFGVLFHCSTVTVLCVDKKKLALSLSLHCIHIFLYAHACLCIENTDKSHRTAVLIDVLWLCHTLNVTSLNRSFKKGSIRAALYDPQAWLV